MAFDVHEYLGSCSVPEAQVTEAEQGGYLPLLVIDQLLFGGGPRLTSQKVAEDAGVDPDVAKRLWRAMGFTEAAEDAPILYPDDLEALRIAAAELGRGAPLEVVERYTRTMNAAISRIAEAIGDEFVTGLRSLREAGVNDDEAADFVQRTMHVEELERLLGYFFRRHLRDALWRKMAVPAELLGHPMLTVGFVDLVRFTAITEEIAEDELDALVSRFGEVAHGTITDRGGRMVKMIGDEVMFVADDVAVGALIALDLVDAYAADEQLPPARAGISCGEVLSREGDYFGPVVNLASRIVDVARPNTVVASEAVRDGIEGVAGVTSKRLPPKRLKGIGLTRLWSLRRERV